MKNKKKFGAVYSLTNLLHSMIFVTMFVTNPGFATQEEKSVEPSKSNTTSDATVPISAVVTAIENQPNADSSKPTMPSTPTVGIQFNAETISKNICYGLKGMPYRTYIEFGMGTDGKFYGNKEGRIVPISVNPQFKAGESGAEVQVVDPTLTIASFKTTNNISDEVCKAAKVNFEKDGSNANTGSSQTSGQQNRKQKYPPKSAGANCSVANQADSYVLAMSWQPAFCEDKPGKPECKESKFIQPDVYHADNFTLHGFWPNKKGCGINYGFCSSIKSKNSFGDYDKLNLTDNAFATLEKVMPSLAAGSGLERHEWYKHGTCQSLNVSDYFTYASDLVQQFNDLKVVMDKIREAKGSTIKKSELLAALASDDAFGKDKAAHIQLSCKKKMLTEIQIPIACERAQQATDSNANANANANTNANANANSGTAATATATSSANTATAKTDQNAQVGDSAPSVTASTAPTAQEPECRLPIRPNLKEMINLNESGGSGSCPEEIIIDEIGPSNSKK